MIEEDSTGRPGWGRERESGGSFSRATSPVCGSPEDSKGGALRPTHFDEGSPERASWRCARLDWDGYDDSCTTRPPIRCPIQEKKRANTKQNSACQQRQRRRAGSKPPMSSPPVPVHEQPVVGVRAGKWSLSSSLIPSLSPCGEEPVSSLFWRGIFCAS